jgi:peptidoglycan/xylan/chitin deacetylase (PgdA/CDA1 family)
MLCQTGLLRLAQAMKKDRTLLPILAYHRVCDFDLSNYPFDQEVISASTLLFDQQVDFVKRNFDCLVFSDLKDAIDGRRSLPKRPLMITFDDGYADNYSNAFTILKRHGLSATFFITTDIIGTQNPFWWEKVVYWVKRGETPKNILKGSNLQMDGAANPWDVIHWLKSRTNPVRVDLLDGWEKEYPLPVEHGLHWVQPLNWDEVRKMSQGGMEIGSHTVTHPVLTQLSEEDLCYELTASKKRIEMEIGKEVLSIAYPGGKQADHDERVHRASAQLYNFGLAYDGGINSLHHLNPYQLKRLAVEHRSSLAFFKSRVVFPSLFSYRQGVQD